MRVHAVTCCLAALALALPALAQVRPPATGELQVPEAAVQEVEVTFLANEGFLLRSGRYSVLIDAFVKEPFYIYEALPPLVYQDLVRAAPPFDGLVLALVSHDHSDHFHARGIERYLNHNKQAQLITSAQVITSLKTAAKDFAAIQEQVTPVRVEIGKPEILMHEEMSIRFLGLRHTGAENEKVQNLGHLLHMGALKILHVGDAEPSIENFAAYGLGGMELDIAFVPYWYFGSPEGQSVIEQQLKPRTLVACHVPPKELEKFVAAMGQAYPDLVIFKEALEKRTFRPQGAGTGGG